MTSVFDQPWFGWALAVVIGFPVLLVILTEWHTALVRRGSALAKPISLLRNYVLPAGALLILLTQAGDVSAQATPVRIIATVFGFVVLLMLLAAINAALFTNAERGTWQQRIPSIFVDIVRLVLIIAGLAVLFSFVWDADVAGLFTALGVTSIVLGLALQNAVGSVISGLLLLFEQPFQLGDWLQTPTARGRVVEVNWRAVHIDTGNGIQIMPNAALASASFTNLSRPSGAHAVTIASTFALQDRPDEVLALLARVAGDLPAGAGRHHPVGDADRAEDLQHHGQGRQPGRGRRGDRDAATLDLVRGPSGGTASGRGRRQLQRSRTARIVRPGGRADPATDEADIDRPGQPVRASSAMRQARSSRKPALVPDSMRLIIAGRANLNVRPAGRQFLCGAQACRRGVHRADRTDQGAGDSRRQRRR